VPLLLLLALLGATPEPPTEEAPLPARHELAPPLLHAWPIPVENRAPPANWWLPPLETVGFVLALNQFNRNTSSDPAYQTTPRTAWQHLTGPWWWDGDGFLTNQFAHPYQGSLFFNMSRSLGHGFWWSAGNAAVGSYLWEVAGELEPPSVNDQVTTTVSGAFLGEILFRLSSRILDGGGAAPNLGRQLAAAVVSPVAGFNRVLFGNTYRPYGYTSHPAFGRIQLGFQTAADLSQAPTGFTSRIRHVSLGGELVYGLPVGDWQFEEPFDAFDVTVDVALDEQASTRDAIGILSIHGLLAGTGYGSGRSRGLWGLFGTYDFITPAAFRASSAAFGPGTTGQLLLGSSFALQGTVIASVGFGAGGASASANGARDYHFGLQAVCYGSAQLFLEDRLRLRVTGRQYFTSGNLSPEPDSWERTNFTQASLLWRVWGLHAVGVEWSGAQRAAFYPKLPAIHARSNQLEFFYSLLSDRAMGLGRLVE
jgi:hypothetical protein